ncbi:MAG: CDP-glucose 4,6-dehydratase [Ruminococcus sp.]|nr:CDP-glucose 4,6-dehydratase [Ruminococcus sp.]
MMNSYYNKKVLITGHTGFKGTWLCRILMHMGAKIYGYALEPNITPSLFDLCGMSQEMESYIGDIRDLNGLSAYMQEIQPEIIFHLAAQPIVRESYVDPVYTYHVNVMGTVNLLESIRSCEAVKSVVNVTTDKVYKNREWCWSYRENEELNGYDPYSNSKSCSELVTESYINSFFYNRDISISTARAGNVIGGGDFARDRIIPDCFRAVQDRRTILVRNPLSIRPYQHVLEALSAYIMIEESQYKDVTKSGCYNVGPDDVCCWNTECIVDEFCRQWRKLSGEMPKWECVQACGPHEANCLKLDNSKIKNVIGWNPRWDVSTAVQKVAEWDWIYMNNGDIIKCMDNQIENYFGDR